MNYKLRVALSIFRSRFTVHKFRRLVKILTTEYRTDRACWLNYYCGRYCDEINNKERCPWAANIPSVRLIR